MNIKPDNTLISDYATVMTFKRDARARILEDAANKGVLVDDSDLDQTTIIDHTDQDTEEEDSKE